MKEADKPECVNYRRGFCVQGAMCRYRHSKLNAEAMPLLSDLYTGEGTTWKEMQAAMQAASRAHHVGHTTGNALQDLQARYEAEGASRQLPDLHSRPSYFLVKASSPTALAVGMKGGHWLVNEAQASAVAAGQKGTGPATEEDSKPPAVFLFFSIWGSKHFQAVAEVTGAAGEPDAESGLRQLPLTFHRTFALPLVDTLRLPNSAAGRHPLPFFPHWGKASREAGRALMLLSYEAPEVRVDLDKAQGPLRVDLPSGITEDLGLPVPGPGHAPQPPVPAQAAAAAANVPPRQMAEAIARAFSAQGVFLFESGSEAVQEALQRGLVGGARRHTETAKRHIHPGVGILILDVQRRLLVGLLRATSPPGLHARGALVSPQTECPDGADVQVRVEPVARCQPAAPPVYQHLIGPQTHTGLLPPQVGFGVAMELLRSLDMAALRQAFEGVGGGGMAPPAPHRGGGGPPPGRGLHVQRRQGRRGGHPGGRHHGGWR